MKITQSQLSKIIKEELEKLKLERFTPETMGMKHKLEAIAKLVSSPGAMHAMSVPDIYKQVEEIVAGGSRQSMVQRDPDVEPHPDMPHMGTYIEDPDTGQRAYAKGKVREAAYEPGRGPDEWVDPTEGMTDDEIYDKVSMAINQIRELLEDAHELAQYAPDNRNKGEGAAMFDLVRFIDNMYEMYGSESF